MYNLQFVQYLLEHRLGDSYRVSTQWIPCYLREVLLEP